jgi:putative transposase
MSTFATVRLRTAKTRGQANAKNTIAMVFKLMKEAEKRYAKFKGYKLIPLVMEGKIFKNGEIQKSVA